MLLVSLAKGAFAVIFHLYYNLEWKGQSYNFLQVDLFSLLFTSYSLFDKCRFLLAKFDAEGIYEAVTSVAYVLHYFQTIQFENLAALRDQGNGQKGQNLARRILVEWILFDFL